MLYHFANSSQLLQKKTGLLEPLPASRKKKLSFPKMPAKSCCFKLRFGLESGFGVVWLILLHARDFMFVNQQINLWQAFPKPIIFFEYWSS